MAADLAASSGLAEQAGLITTSIRRKFIPVLRNKLRMAPFAAKGTLQMHGGSVTLRWNLLTDVAEYTQPLADTSSATEQNEHKTLSITAVEMTVADYGAFSKLSDLSMASYTRETRQQFAESFAYSGAKTKDSLLRNAATDASGTFFIAGATTAPSAAHAGSLTASNTAIAQDLNFLRGFFDQNDCDGFDSLGGNYALIVHGKAEQDMVGDVTTTRLSWSPLIQNVPEGVSRFTAYKGPGVLLGMAVMRSNNITTADLTASATAHANIALADHGIGCTTLNQSDPRIIIKTPGPNSVSVPLDTYSTMGWKMRLAQARLSTTRCITYYSFSNTTA